jgi:lysophospholipase L1-like esterase
MCVVHRKTIGTRLFSVRSIGRLAASLYLSAGGLAVPQGFATSEASVACPSFTTEVSPPEGPRNDLHSREQLAKINASIKSQPHRVLFLGDSITERWPPKIWQQSFAPFGSFNAGIDGDRTDHLLTRIRRLKFEGESPKVVVLLIATNDLGHGRSPEAAAEGVRANLLELHERLPQARILLLGLLPRWDRFGPVIDAVNQLIKTCNGGAVTYTDLGNALLDQGRVSRATSPDGVHLSEAGYARLAHGLKPLIGSLLGLPQNAIPEPSAAAAPPIDAEIVFWQSIPPNAAAVEYEEYLRQYPQGRFAAQAQNLLVAARPPTPPAVPATAIPPPADPDALFWQGIAASSRAADFEEYLREYPEGRFAAVARNQLTALQAGQSQATPPPPTAAPQAAVIPVEELLKKGKAALDRKDYAQAMRLFSQAADKGNPRAMHDIAVLYEKGWGVAKNNANAMTWYRRAAEPPSRAIQRRRIGSNGMPNDRNTRFPSGIGFLIIGNPALSGPCSPRVGFSRTGERAPIFNSVQNATFILSLPPTCVAQKTGA